MIDTVSAFALSVGSALVTSVGWVAVLGWQRAKHLGFAAEDAAYKQNADEVIVDLQHKLGEAQFNLTNARARSEVLAKRNLQLSFDNGSLKAELAIWKRPRDAKGHFISDRVAA